MNAANNAFLYGECSDLLFLDLVNQKRSCRVHVASLECLGRRFGTCGPLCVNYSFFYQTQRERFATGAVKIHIPCLSGESWLSWNLYLNLRQGFLTQTLLEQAKRSSEDAIARVPREIWACR